MGKLAEKLKKEKFAYDVSSIGAYVDETSTDVLQEITYSSGLVARIQVDEGVKGSKKIKLMSMNIPLQSGENCGKTPDGSIIFNDKTLATEAIKVDLKVCNKDLEGTWAQMLLALGQSRQNKELVFPDVVAAFTVKKAQFLNQNLMINGDTLSGDTNLAFYDGFKKLWDADVAVLDAASTQVAITATNALAVFKEVAAKVPELLLNNDIKPEIICSRVDAQFVLDNIYATKDYASSIQVSDIGGELSFTLPTTGFTVRSYPQLGVGEVYAVPYEFMFYGTDLESDDSDFYMFYDEKEESIYFGVNWRSGIQYVYPEYFVKLTLGN
jgi:hypothetical protein